MTSPGGVIVNGMLLLFSLMFCSTISVVFVGCGIIEDTPLHSNQTLAMQIDGPTVHVDAIECHFVWHPLFPLSACRANYTPHPEGFYVTDIELYCPTAWKNTDRCSIRYKTSYINMDQKQNYMRLVFKLAMNDFVYNHFAIWAQGIVALLAIMWYMFACILVGCCIHLFVFSVRTLGASQDRDRVTPDEARALAAERHPRLFANEECIDLIDILECSKDRIWKRRTSGSLTQSYDDAVCEALTERIRSVRPLPCAPRDPANTV